MAGTAKPVVIAPIKPGTSTLARAAQAGRCRSAERRVRRSLPGQRPRRHPAAWLALRHSQLCRCHPGAGIGRLPGHRPVRSRLRDHPLPVRRHAPKRPAVGLGRCLGTQRGGQRHLYNTEYTTDRNPRFADLHRQVGRMDDANMLGRRSARRCWAACRRLLQRAGASRLARGRCRRRRRGLEHQDPVHQLPASPRGTHPGPGCRGQRRGSLRAQRQRGEPELAPVPQGGAGLRVTPSPGDRGGHHHPATS